MRAQANPARGLYHPSFEHDACGIGAVVDIQGHPSHETVDDVLKIVEKLEHRAGKDAAGETGDGVGILLQVSHRFFSKAAAACGITLPGPRDYGVGMFFFPRDVLRRSQAKKMFEVILEKEGLPFLGWRTVPVCPDILGQRARDKMPCIEQAFVARPEGVEQGLAFDRKLYVARRVFEQSNDNTYVPSFSSRTVVYKGMFLVGQLRKFYPDLQDPDYESALALVHSRFSTNTNPSWERAHPNRLMAHNGEINTIRGNVDRMLAREETMSSPLLEADMDKVLPVVDVSGSDSAMLDNTLEFLMMAGMDLPLAVMACIPEPWMGDQAISRTKRDLYQYYATLMEPWDGPASILFSDGDVVGAVLDRNGLRPSRYYVTKDGRLILASEVGVLDIPADQILEKSRLQPGRMLLVDLKQGRILSDEELKETYAARQPYGEWLDRNLLHLSDLPIPNKRVERRSKTERQRLRKAFGYTYEDVRSTILPMARTGAEPTAAMGIDIPLAVLDSQDQPLFQYFKQLFAQVTNPPIDAIREEIVTDTTVYVGDDGNLLEERPENCRVLQIHNPILTSTDLMKIKAMKQPGFQVATVSLLYYKNTPLDRALDRLEVAVDRAYREGANVVILSDRGVDENHVAIPSLLAVADVEQHLIRTKKRTAVSILLESAEPRDVHHFATLLGYGARAINPYLVEETIVELIEEGVLDKDFHTAVHDYNAAILHGIVKIASKMGISTLQSYQSAQIFEAVGIDQAVIDRCFTNTVSRVGGIGLKEIAAMVDRNHSKAFDPLGQEVDLELDSLGAHKARSGGEDHLYNPQTIHLLQQAARRGDYALFRQYTALVDDETKPHTLRGLLDMKYADTPIPLDEVESVDSIVKRFKTGAMSYGSISQEAHECLAQAMNLLGGKSNSGEGGEEPDRLQDPARCSAIKQVASGRFGVTSEYLVSAKEIQIKMAQGAKPGEGGHLPAGKVYPWIAKCRHSTPGVTLISPPPHHDIYSIEDLAQLIYDLKNANRRARISVKLVSEAGVGTIAAGVAKAGAQVVLISGYDGGTGAAPRTSIHNAGLPWELGLAETHQTLIQNGLRSRVVVETDGKLMSGRDVAIACMLGAEEFGFATAPLVTLGCVMMRVCNLDTCPVGVATQNPELRKRFAGKPEYVVNFMRFIAQELREHMAKLGVRTVEELVGRTDLLQVRKPAVNARAASVDLSAILDNPYLGTDAKTHFDPADVYDFHLEDTVDMGLEQELGNALQTGEPRRLERTASSTDRAVGTLLGSDITRLHGSALPEGTFTVHCTGGGGQSFGAFLPQGLTLELEGDANDYLGKGLSGGTLVVYPPQNSAFEASENILVGNVALYGATSGKAFLSGVAGERFCVRNSGATAVVEGVGDHGCEYMTGGRVVVLGPTGKNFAAGMSGGVAFVLDEHRDLYLRLNKSLVSMDPVTEPHDIAELRGLIEAHAEATGSVKAKHILEQFEHYLPLFKKILPHDYDRMLRTIAQYEERGMTWEQAQVEAFYVNTRKVGE
ncbi:glutamate synthase large subunit [Flavonifractor sp. An92]|uniref:glutamate synthase large subunit n=1 Tax=Flavonifractor sp. An92 TaxID=1965666 RepID=UPI000B3A300E|nr:glutamate synthase large subunit [Flavonifractor sp. An92]OUN08804.1 glutamate synthase large subunit [Flavonifractor sp. An92]